MLIHGACLCEATSYEAHVEPARAIQCSCSDCKAISAAPCRASIPTTPQSLRVRGLPRTFTDFAQRVVPVVFAFCGQCGTALYAHRLIDPQWLSLWLGAIRERGSLAVTRYGYCAAGVPQDNSVFAPIAVAPTDLLNADRVGRDKPDMDETEANALLDISDLIRWLWFSETGEDLWQDEREPARISTRTSLPPQTHS